MSLASRPQTVFTYYLLDFGFYAVWSFPQFPQKQQQRRPDQLYLEDEMRPTPK